jgi:hypothetical protein
MIEATEYPFTIEQGSTFQAQFRWRVDGQIVNLTGYAAKMQLRRSYSTPVVFELSSSNNRIFLGGAAGTIDLDITAEDAASIPAGNYLYDLELTVGTVVRKLLKGNVVVIAEVTK